jgi:hypothetical protein
MYQMTRQERQRDILLMDSYRDRKKMVNIHNSLREQITTRHTVRASFGKAYYFEFLFTNPYDRDQNFEIAWDDAELRVVVDANEWKYLRRINEIRVGVEEKFINVLPSGTSSIFLMPNETVAIPFVYQSFLSGYSQFKSTDEDLAKMMQGSGIPETPIHARTINVLSPQLTS